MLQKAVWRDMALVFALALVARIAFALPQQQPGYMDAYYYTVGAQQLAAGRGFTEPFVWNYLDDPSGLPQPSHQYWMPLPSILAALAMRAFGSSFRAAQAPFIVLSALLAVITYAIAWQTTAIRRHAWAGALFAIFSGFFVPVWSVPETFASFAVFGSVCLWAASKEGWWWALVAGGCAGLAHLTRADGVLLLFPAVLIGPVRSRNRGTIIQRAWHILCMALGYAAVISPWLIHNWATTGRLLSAAGAKTVFLTTYDDLYSFGKALDLPAYLAWGFLNIVRSKLDGLGANLATLVAVDGLVFLAPLALAGFWLRRRDRLYRMAALYGVALYLVMSIVFTFPGMRGGMFHSSAALLPFIFAGAMVGLDAAIDWVAARRATWDARSARRVFTVGLVAGAVLFSGMIYASRVRDWNQADAVYKLIGGRLAIESSPVVMVNDPPGYFYHAGQPAIAIPNGDIDILLAVARRYGARWVVLDANYPAALAGLYERPQSDPRLILVETLQAGKSGPVYLLKLEDAG